jgi:hypothetical protein
MAMSKKRYYQTDFKPDYERNIIKYLSLSVKNITTLIRKKQIAKKINRPRKAPALIGTP